MADDNNIYMAANDIADDPSNPYQGQIYNWPTSRNGWNQVQFDYEGDQVTKERFLAILKGDATAAGGPVLGSDENSTVFVFFSGPASEAGQADMPYGDPLTEAELMEAINYMHENKMYKQLVIYWSSDYSGSMFANLPGDTKVLAMTSASATET